VNAEILGDDSPYVDAEAIAAAHSLMTDMGATGLVMEINSVGCPNCRSQYRKLLQDFFKDRTDELCSDCRRRLHTNPMRILDCKVPMCAQMVKDAPLITDSLDQPCREHFQRVREALELLEIPYRLEPRMVRGLDYYTRTAFEIVHEERGRSKAVGGGGRYDNLLGELGGPDASGIGFAIGLERLAMGIADDDPRFRRRIDVYVALVGENARDTGLTLVNMLRRNGISVETRYTSMSLKAQMKLADKIGAQKVIMLGDDELTRQEVTIRDMRTKEQIAVKMDGIVKCLQGEQS